VEFPSGDLGLELLPAPEPDEVVAALLEEVEVGVLVELLEGIGPARAGTHPIVQIVPDVRAGQVDGRAVARCDREVRGFASETTRGPAAFPPRMRFIEAPPRVAGGALQLR
jgi:hypothetical protein